MKKKLAVSITSIIAASLLLSHTYQPSDAVEYYGHDGSIDKSMKKTVVEPLKGKNGFMELYCKSLCK